MTLLRFIFPFLFVRNWQDGSWELSRARLILFGIFLVLLALGVLIIYVLHSPVMYSIP